MKIVFCHNVFDRFLTLHHTLKIEKVHYPFSNSIIGFNNADPRDHVKYHWNDIEFLKYDGMTHKIGCTNGCIATIQAAIKHKPDVIVFSHDDVYLHQDYLSVFSKNINMIGNGECDVIVRRTPDTSVIGGKYYMMEAFMLSLKAANECFSHLHLFQDEQEIDNDIRGSISPEVFLYRILNKEGIKLHVLEYDNAAPIEKYNELLGQTIGFYHKNIGYRGWNDETNYTQSWKLF